MFLDHAHNEGERINVLTFQTVWIGLGGRSREGGEERRLIVREWAQPGEDVVVVIDGRRRARRSAEEGVGFGVGEY
jgi:hypothetical protein